MSNTFGPAGRDVLAGYQTATFGWRPNSFRFSPQNTIKHLHVPPFSSRVSFARSSVCCPHKFETKDTAERPAGRQVASIRIPANASGRAIMPCVVLLIALDNARPPLLPLRPLRRLLLLCYSRRSAQG